MRSVSCFLLLSLFVVSCQGADSSLTPKDWARSSAGKEFHHFTLLSWRFPNGAWCFSLREGNEIDKRVRGMTRFQVLGVSALKKRFIKIPTGAHINWTKFHAIGFDYPPAKQLEDVKRCADRLGIYLYFNFVTEE